MYALIDLRRVPTFESKVIDIKQIILWNQAGWNCLAWPFQWHSNQLQSIILQSNHIQSIIIEYTLQMWMCGSRKYSIPPQLNALWINYFSWKQQTLPAEGLGYFTVLP